MSLTTQPHLANCLPRLVIDSSQIHTAMRDFMFETENRSSLCGSCFATLRNNRQRVGWSRRESRSKRSEKFKCPARVMEALKWFVSTHVSFSIFKTAKKGTTISFDTMSQTSISGGGRRSGQSSFYTKGFFPLERVPPSFPTLLFIGFTFRLIAAARNGRYLRIPNQQT